ncbi:hypothetical protein GCM10007898_05460 [Dyella flagellata]|uniref:Transposase n=1 Tax=Dyella flagellata TaxID=1867833 RepID=A0ABQ5X5R8_9GAMM|nr:hypothetical protein GCM10007898_05460 [Dyella flagellata]
MIGKGVRNHLDPLRAETGKEALRMADRGHRMDAHAGKAGKSLLTSITQSPRGAATQAHGHFAHLRVATVADAKIDLLKTPQRLTQRSRRKQAGIAKAALAIDYANFHIAGKAVMLQAIVRDDDVASFIEQ